MVGTAFACHRRQVKLPKFSYYLIHWVFDYEGHTRLATPEELNIQISLRQSADDKKLSVVARQLITHLASMKKDQATTKPRKSTSSAKARKIANLISAQTIARSDGWMDNLPKHLFSQHELQPTQ
jgi:hypothetical protein